MAFSAQANRRDTARVGSIRNLRGALRNQIAETSVDAAISGRVRVGNLDVRRRVIRQGGVLGLYVPGSSAPEPRVQLAGQVGAHDLQELGPQLRPALGERPHMLQVPGGDLGGPRTRTSTGLTKPL
jgi:hypothetical protein